MIRTRWSRLALRDLSKIEDHYADIAPDFHDRVEGSVLKVARFLLESPHAGTPFGQLGARTWSIPHMPYIMIYRPFPDDIQLLRIYHARENGRTV